MAKVGMHALSASHLDAIVAPSIPYSLNISRGKIFTDFEVLGVIGENCSLDLHII